MKLEANELRELLEITQRTEEREMNCEESLAWMARLAEAQLAGVEVGEELRMARQHLTVCGECAEEYRALLAAIES